MTNNTSEPEEMELCPTCGALPCDQTNRALPAGWRPEVMAFADLMEAQLRANDHKPGWKNDHQVPLLHRLRQETEELSAELAVGSPSSIGREAADVANFALMIADVCGALAAAPDPSSQGGEDRGSVGSKPIGDGHD